MELAPAGREYAHWDVTGAAVDLALEVSFDVGATWRPLTRTGDDATALVAGPSATDNPVGTVVLTLGSNAARIRAADNPEVVIRAAGIITVREPR